MRLNEFTDPTDYIPTDAANLLEQIESLWPVGTRDDDAPLGNSSEAAFAER